LLCPIQAEQYAAFLSRVKADPTGMLLEKADGYRLLTLRTHLESLRAEAACTFRVLDEKFVAAAEAAKRKREEEEGSAVAVAIAGRIEALLEDSQREGREPSPKRRRRVAVARRVSLVGQEGDSAGEQEYGVGAEGRDADREYEDEIEG
jgi:hypothetical protein